MLNGKTTTIKNTSSTFNEVINYTLTDLNIKTIESEMFFIPVIKVINSIRIPSTPFNSKTGLPLFMGDVIEIYYSDEYHVSKEIYLVDMKDGQYVGTNQNPNHEEPLWMLDEAMITVLGNSVADPNLLNMLGN